MVGNMAMLVLSAKWETDLGAPKQKGSSRLEFAVMLSFTLVQSPQSHSPWTRKSTQTLATGLDLNPPTRPHTPTHSHPKPCTPTQLQSTPCGCVNEGCGVIPESDMEESAYLAIACNSTFSAQAPSNANQALNASLQPEQGRRSQTPTPAHVGSFSSMLHQLQTLTSKNNPPTLPRPPTHHVVILQS